MKIKNFVIETFLTLLGAFILTLFSNYLRYGYFIFEKTAVDPIIIDLTDVAKYYIAPSMINKYWGRHIFDKDRLKQLIQKQKEQFPSEQVSGKPVREFLFDEEEGIIALPPHGLVERLEVITSYFLLKSQGQVFLVTISDPVGWGNADIHPIKTKKYLLKNGKFVLHEENYEEYNIEGFENTIGAFILFSILLFFLFRLNWLIKFVWGKGL